MSEIGGCFTIYLLPPVELSAEELAFYSEIVVGPSDVERTCRVRRQPFAQNGYSRPKIYHAYEVGYQYSTTCCCLLNPACYQASGLLVIARALPHGVTVVLKSCAASAPASRNPRSSRT